MAFNPAPTVFFGTNYSENGTTLSIPISAFPELTAAEADATTGDSRKFIYALLHRFHTTFTAIPAANRPSRMTVSRTIGAINPTNNEFATSFTFNFTVSANDVDVAAE
jgi:hypothetical protein